MEIHQSMWIQWSFFPNFTAKGQWYKITPRWTLTPHLLESHVWLYPSIIVFILTEINQSGWIQWSYFQQNCQWSQMTPRWRWIPHLLMLHVRLYPKVTVYKSHENTPIYMDTTTIFFHDFNPKRPIKLIWLHIWLHTLIKRSMTPNVTFDLGMWPLTSEHMKFPMLYS